MPAINVAKTDTFESQRQKINQIGAAIFNISQGGSDLSTGNLKLGDGSRTTPSLAFISDTSLGLYKTSVSTFGFVGSGKKIADYSESSIFNYKNVILQQNILFTDGLSVLNYGNNYDPGTYSYIFLIGGTGDNATIDLVVTEFSGTVINSGENYIEGSYSEISLVGGSGTGAIVSFDIEGIEGNIVNAGSGYIPGTYTEISLTGGSGSGSEATVTITGETIINGTISSPGSGYTESVYNNVSFLNTATDTFVVTVISNPGTPPPDNVYQIDGITQDTLTLIRGNTYRFDISSPTISTHPLIFRSEQGEFLSTQNFITNQKGLLGNSGSFIEFIIKPTAPLGNIKYDCSVHPNMGGIITIVDGVVGVYGNGMVGTITVGASGEVTNVLLTSTGSGYLENNILTVFSDDVGSSGSGFSYILGAPSYTGIVSTIEITNNGIDYLNNNTLSFNSSDVGGFGSGFQFLITSNPGIVSNLTFNSKGIDYEATDILSLPIELNGITTTLKSEVFGLSSTLNISTPVITLLSTDGILSGMIVTVSPFGSVGELAVGTTVLSVDSSTQITLSQNPTVDGNADLNFDSPGDNDVISLLSVEGIIVGSNVTQTSGNGVLSSNTTVSSVDVEQNTVTLSELPTKAGSATLSFTPPYGNPTENFQYVISNIGSVESFSINLGGNGYSLNDTFVINPFDLTQPITYNVTNKNLQVITFVDNISDNIFSVGDTIQIDAGITVATEIYSIISSGGFIQSILVESNDYQSGDIVTGNYVSTPLYEIDTASDILYKFFIDTGNGPELTPNLILYVGNTYLFDLSDSSNSSHIFSLSKFKDGSNSPSLIENIDTTLSTLTSQISVSSTLGILEGMQVQVTSGTGSLALNTTVLEVVNSTTIILSAPPIATGEVTLKFNGVEYTDNVTRSGSSLTLKVTEDTPNLYYYCSSFGDEHQNEGGFDNIESIFTINSNNPKLFGSGFSLSAFDIDTENVITQDVENGELTAISFVGNSAEFDLLSATQSLIAPSIEGDVISANSIISSSNLNLTANNINIAGNFNVGNNVEIANSTGNITSSGTIRADGSLNVNNILTIINNNISTSTGNNLLITPPAGRVAKIVSTGALTIPAGTTAERPISSVVENGSIRFNIQTNQYEGYSATTSSWSSLGGVRDLDGNTYITAEESIGSNDNRLWFYNDNINTVRFTPTFQEFVNVKKIRSINISAPNTIDWLSNSPVNAGQYLKYRNNIYEVVVGGTTGTSGNEPTDTTGADFTNGTATLRYFTPAVAPLTFEEISELRIAPNGGTSLSINNDLRLQTNVISTDVNDLLIRQNTGKKVTIDSSTSLVLPVGDSNERGAPIQGSVRFNTSISQYEGYDGTNWSSLGGVRDVDGNTYIIPETSAGSNENILYFYNNNSNTLRVTENQIEFDTIDTINSVTSNLLNLNAQLITFNNLAASIDTSGPNTFITTTQGNLDLGLASGLANDPLLRLSDTGDIYYNLGFGSGVYNGVKIFDSELKELEIADFKISTTKVTLTRNTVNTGSAVLYDPTLHESAKVQIIAHNTITGNKEFVEYSVIDNGTDIFFTDFGNVKTGSELISCVFDFNANNNVRVTFTLDNSVVSGNTIEVTVISNIIKR